MNFKKEELVKSPLNYTGGKYKLLPQLLERFPNKINTLYDVFGGGCNVGINVKANKIICNDIVNFIIDMFKEMKLETVETSITKIHKIINDYNLSKDNLEGFLKLREDYNKGKQSWDYFFTLVVHSFNNQFRFNNKHQYNSSFGMNKSWYKPVTEERLIAFINKLNNTNIEFINKDFRDIDFSDADKNDLVYLDPPYLITCGNYNDGKRGFKGWNEKDEIDLLNLLDKLDEQGTRFALSNVLENKGKSNDILKEWCQKYNVINLNNTYGNCNYHAKDKSKDGTVEVLITNYNY